VRADTVHWYGQRDLSSALINQLTENQNNIALYEVPVPSPASKSTFH